MDYSITLWFSADDDAQANSLAHVIGTIAPFIVDNVLVGDVAEVTD